MSFITHEKKSRIQSILLFASLLFAFIVTVFSASARAEVPDWVREARIGGADLYSEMNDEALMEVLTLRQSENVSVLEIDTRLSEYLTEEEFDQEVAFLDHAAQKAHELGMYAVIYYPSLEVITPNGVISRSTMYKDHPDWVQYGINGDPNVFYGNAGLSGFRAGGRFWFIRHHGGSQQ